MPSVGTRPAPFQNPGTAPMNMRRAAKSLRLVICFLAAVTCLPATESKPDEPDKAAKPAADSILGKNAGQVRDDNVLNLKLVWCPAGQFRMGSPKSEVKRNKNQVEVILENQVEVILRTGYWLGKCEVTQSQWKQVMATEPWKGKGQTKESDGCPATFVSWNDATDFGRKFTELERMAGRLPDGWEYTLPAEAQWERACRAGTETKFSFGDDDTKLPDSAWFADNTFGAGEQYAHSVGLKKPNLWGLHDMHGNVMEWCRDWYAAKLPGGRDPEVTEMGKRRVIRGGGWSLLADDCRSPSRLSSDPSYRDCVIGFRLALSPSGNK